MTAISAELFKACPVPAPARLAAFAPGFDLQGHSLQDHAKHWFKEYQETDGNDMLRYKIAETMLSMCLATVNGRIRRHLAETGYNVPQRFRQHMLSLMAVSALVQLDWTQETPLRDGEALGEATSVSDIFVNDGPYRHHQVSPGADMTPTPEVGVWYRHENLYLREVRPADPSPSLEQFLEQQGVTVDFSQATTYYPFLASQRLVELTA